jgi:type II secretory pathway component GspD/PulD (secretin)
MKRQLLIVLFSVALLFLVRPGALSQNRIEQFMISTDDSDDGELPSPEQQNESEVRDYYEQMASELLEEEEEVKEIFFYECKHVRSETIRRLLTAFVTPSGTVAASDEADIVVVSDVPDNIEVLKRIAEEMDRPVPQVLVQAQVVELTVDSDFEKEINLAFEELPETTEAFVKEISAALGTPASSPNTTEGALLTFQPWIEGDGEERRMLTAFLRYLETRGKARILSAPSLILTRGTEGSIITGEEVPVLTATVTSGSISTSTKFKSVGIKLHVRPIMVTGGKVRLEISPEVSTVTGYTSAGEGVSNPTIAVRNARTELQLLDGQLVSIGGLFRNEEREVERRVPILGSVPLLGHLFRSRRVQSVKTQLVIFLSIRILDAADMNSVTIQPLSIPQPVLDSIEEMENRAGEQDQEDVIPGE